MTNNLMEISEKHKIFLHNIIKLHNKLKLMI
mgnify:CR=1 FL=1